MASTFKVNEAGFRKYQQAVAAGLLDIGYYIEGEAKAITPVHGDGTQGGPFKTFVPGAKPIGGTLRRSIHTVAYIAGRVVFGTGGSDDNGASIPDYSAGERSDILVVVGTNLEYALFVHDGTVKMKKRPFLSTAYAKSTGVFARLFAAGFKRHI